MTPPNKTHKSAVRHLSAVDDSDLFLAAEFDKTVLLYKKGEPDPVRRFDTHLDFGGRRLQVVPQRDLFIAGAYERYGVEAYSLTSGTLLWKRADLKRVQRVTLHPDHRFLSCFFEGSAGKVLDVTSGEVVASYRGVQDIRFSDSGEYSLEEGRKFDVKKNGVPLFSIAREGFFLGGVSFSSSQVALCDRGLRIFSLETGSELWRYKPGKKRSVMDVFSTKPSGEALCLQSDTGKKDWLVHVDSTGKVRKELPVANGYARAYFGDRNRLLTAAGDEVDADTGEVVFRYNFPAFVTARRVPVPTSSLPANVTPIDKTAAQREWLLEYQKGGGVFAEAADDYRRKGLVKRLGDFPEDVALTWWVDAWNLRSRRKLGKGASLPPQPKRNR